MQVQEQEIEWRLSPTQIQQTSRPLFATRTCVTPPPSSRARCRKLNSLSSATRMRSGVTAGADAAASWVESDGRATTPASEGCLADRIAP